MTAQLALTLAPTMNPPLTPSAARNHLRATINSPVLMLSNEVTSNR